MRPDTLPPRPTDRLRWLLTESLIIAAIFAFWLGIFIGFAFIVNVLSWVIHVLQLDALTPLYDLLREFRLLWPILTTFAFATTGLYVLVRAGTMLIDRYADQVRT